MIVAIDSLIAQGQDLPRRLSDVVQYVTAAGIVALIGLGVNLVQRTGNIETLLKDPDQGLSPIVSQLRQRVADLGGDMQNYLGRIESQETEIKRVRDRELAAVRLEGRVDVLTKEVEMLRIIAEIRHPRGDTR